MHLLIKSDLRFTCRPGVSRKFKGKVGLFATKDIAANNKIIEKPHYVGRWYYTRDLQKTLDNDTIASLRDLFKNKRLFMDDAEGTYTFVPETPVREFHADMFLNRSKSTANVIRKNDGYYAYKNIEKGDELIIYD